MPHLEVGPDFWSCFCYALENTRSSKVGYIDPASAKVLCSPPCAMAAQGLFLAVIYTIYCIVIIAYIIYVIALLYTISRRSPALQARSLFTSYSKRVSPKVLQAPLRFTGFSVQTGKEILFGKSEGRGIELSDLCPLQTRRNDLPHQGFQACCSISRCPCTSSAEAERASL